MISMKIHHFGYFVEDIRQAEKSFFTLGFVEENAVFDDVRQCQLVLLRLGEVFVELVHPENDSPLGKLSKKFRNMPYHLCLSCSNLNQEAVALREEGFFPIKPAEEAVLFNGRRVIFLFHQQCGIIELLEEQAK